MCRVSKFESQRTTTICNRATETVAQDESGTGPFGTTTHCPFVLAHDVFPKMIQPAVAARWALRMWQVASSLEAIGQHWLGSSAIHLGAAVPSMTPPMLHVTGDATEYRSTLLATFNTEAVDD